ncbi:MAG: hypothetical protein IID39_02790 [Planctomycetes bacterium]|nr:hypothetical protein [Planctomycetota bacterium]
MPPPKTVIRFAALFLGAYTLIMLPWSGWERAYGAIFRAENNPVLSAIWSPLGGEVHLLDLHSDTLRSEVESIIGGTLPRGFPIPEATENKDTLLLLRNVDMPTRIGMLRTGSRLMAYTPLGVLIALALATPISIWRRLWVLAGGLVCVHLFIVIRLSILATANGFADVTKSYHLFEPSPFWKDVLRRADLVLCDNPTFHYLFPVLVWAVAVFLVVGWCAWRSRRAGVASAAA